jgi:hypothetical protein
MLMRWALSKTRERDIAFARTGNVPFSCSCSSPIYLVQMSAPSSTGARKNLEMPSASTTMTGGKNQSNMAYRFGRNNTSYGRNQGNGSSKYGINNNANNRRNQGNGSSKYGFANNMDNRRDDKRGTGFNQKHTHWKRNHTQYRNKEHGGTDHPKAEHSLPKPPPLLERYKQNPVGEALYHKGVECKEQWQDVCKAKGLLSKAVKHLNSHARDLYEEYLGQYVHYPQFNQSSGLYLIDQTTWLPDCIVEAFEGSSDRASTMYKFQSPWTNSHLMYPSNPEKLKEMHRVLLIEMSSIYDFDERLKSVFMMFSDQIDKEEGNIDKDKAILELGNSFVDTHPAGSYYMIENANENLVLFISVAKEYEELNNCCEWETRLIRECEAITHPRIFVYSFFVTDDADKKHYVIYKKFKVHTDCSWHNDIHTEDSQTTCKILSSSLRTMSDTHKPFKREQIAALSWDYNSGPFPAKLFQRILSLQASTSRMCIASMHEGDENGEDERYSSVDDLPNFSSVSVLSCQFRFRSYKLKHYAIMTSRINVVGDSKVAHTAATLQIRTVYCLHWRPSYDVLDAQYISLRQIERKTENVKITPFQQITAGQVGDGFPAFSMDGLPTIRTAGKQPSARQGKKEPMYQGSKEKKKSFRQRGRGDTPLMNAPEDVDDSDDQLDYPIISSSHPVTGTQRRFLDEMDRRAAASMMFHGESRLGATIAQERAEEAMQRWDYNLVRTAQEFISDLDSWMTDVARKKGPQPRRGKSAATSAVAGAVGLKTGDTKASQDPEASAQSPRKDDMEVESYRNKRLRDPADSPTHDTSVNQNTPGRKRVFIWPKDRNASSPFATTGHAQRLREASQLRELALNLADKYPLGRRTCLGPGESLQVIKQQGLLGQGSAVLAAAVLA